MPALRSRKPDVLAEVDQLDQQALNVAKRRADLEAERREVEGRARAVADQQRAALVDARRHGTEPELGDLVAHANEAADRLAAIDDEMMVLRDADAAVRRDRKRLYLDRADEFEAIAEAKSQAAAEALAELARPLREAEQAWREAESAWRTVTSRIDHNEAVSGTPRQGRMPAGEDRVPPFPLAAAIDALNGTVAGKEDTDQDYVPHTITPTPRPPGRPTPEHQRQQGRGGVYLQIGRDLTRRLDDAAAARHPNVPLDARGLAPLVRVGP